MYRSFGKRLADIAISALLLVLAGPVLFAMAFAVRLRLGSPILFRQRRPGLHGAPFTMFKFRTMTEARNSSGGLLPDAARLTVFGRFLRSTSLDELPELWNVLRGDMSLVGPRPLLMQYLPRYTEVQRRRHEVRPGITGLSQVSGRNALKWERKFELDVQYVDSCSLAVDMRILLQTILRLVRREGITQPGQPTAAEFMGTPRP